MARTEIPIQTVAFQSGIANLTQTAGDSTNGHQFDNDGQTVLVIENTGVGAVTATILSVDDPFGRSENLALSVPATTGLALAGPFIPSIWNQGNGSKVFLDLSAATGVTVAAVRLTLPK